MASDISTKLAEVGAMPAGVQAPVSAPAVPAPSRPASGAATFRSSPPPPAERRKRRTSSYGLGVPSPFEASTGSAPDSGPAHESAFDAPTAPRKAVPATKSVALRKDAPPPVVEHIAPAVLDSRREGENRSRATPKRSAEDAALELDLPSAIEPPSTPSILNEPTDSFALVESSEVSIDSVDFDLDFESDLDGPSDYGRVPPAPSVGRVAEPAEPRPVPEPAASAPATSPPSASAPGIEPLLGAEPDMWEPVVDADEPDAAGEPVLAAPDVTGPSHAGQQEDVDAVLGMLRAQHLFHEMDDAPTAWAPAKESKQRGTRVGWAIAIAWVFALLLAGGGYYGWTQWIAHQESSASALVAEAEAESFRGDHADLVDAERHLREARGKHPLGTDGPAVLVFTHAQRALEDGAFDAGYLRPALTRGREIGVDEGLLQAADAVLMYAEGDAEGGARTLAEVEESAPDDPRVLYLLGRLKQRLGATDSEELLVRATEAEPKLVAAQLALAEAYADDGRPALAAERLEAIARDNEDHLRATLFGTYLAADEEEPDAVLARLGELEPRLEFGAPTDRVLFHLTRARLLRRSGETAQAEEEVELASRAGATEPRLQALVATAARSLGRLTRAQQAATAAVASAPAIPEYRKLLAEILVARDDGVRALQVLSPLSNDDPEVLRLGTLAALSVGSPEALAATREAITAHLEAEEEPSAEMEALAIRVRVALGESSEVSSEARRLARDNPGDPNVGLALGEVFLAERRADDAIEALTRVVAAAPEEAEGHVLLARAQRMAGQGEEAEASLRRALELRPGQTSARLLLGYVLLDRGKYEEADELYRELGDAGRSVLLPARLGRVEALLGMGEIEDAKVQFERVRREDRELPSVRSIWARVALADGRPGEAVSALRPLAEQEGATPDTIALYGDALYAAGETTAASEVYERAIEIDAGHPEALIGFAQVLLRGEKHRDAEANLERAERSLESRVRAPALRARLLVLRGRVHLEKRDTRDARDVLRAATEIEGCPAEAFFWLGEALAGSNTPDARAAYERYLELAPAGPLATRARRAIRTQ